jgi:hypothetical protein
MAAQSLDVAGRTVPRIISPHHRPTRALLSSSYQPLRVGVSADANLTVVPVINTGNDFSQCRRWQCGAVAIAPIVAQCRPPERRHSRGLGQQLRRTMQRASQPAQRNRNSGGYHSLAHQGGRHRNRVGNNDMGQAIPPAHIVSAVAAGTGIVSPCSERQRSWLGDNSFGQIRSPGLSRVKTIAASGSHNLLCGATARSWPGAITQTRRDLCRTVGRPGT